MMLANKSRTNELNINVENIFVLIFIRAIAQPMFDSMKKQLQTKKTWGQLILTSVYHRSLLPLSDLFTTEKSTPQVSEDSEGVLKRVL